jgi:hypothetical protein
MNKRILSSVLILIYLCLAISLAIRILEFYLELFKSETFCNFLCDSVLNISLS